GIAVTWIRQARPRRRLRPRPVIVGDLLRTESCSVLPTRGDDQSIERIVGVVVRGFDALVLEKNHRLRVRIISDSRDVADGVVEVAEKLNDLLSRGDARGSLRLESDQAKRLLIVRVRRKRPIAQ